MRSGTPKAACKVRTKCDFQAARCIRMHARGNDKVNIMHLIGPHAVGVNVSAARGACVVC